MSYWTRDRRRRRRRKEAELEELLVATVELELQRDVLSRGDVEPDGVEVYGEAWEALTGGVEEVLGEGRFGPESDLLNWARSTMYEAEPALYIRTNMLEKPF